MLQTQEMSQRIAIIVDRASADFWTSNYLLALMRKRWELLGFTVTVVTGPDRYVEADLAILHVDLTRVPERYMAIARRYPVVINGKVQSISKRSSTTLQVERDSGYAGPVIVKTDLNAGGSAEAKDLAGSGLIGRARSSVLKRLPSRWSGRIRKNRYPVYDSVELVPRWVWSNKRFVVDRFMPERRGDKYCLRRWVFFGDRECGSLAVSDCPIVKSANNERVAWLDDVPEELRAVRERLGFDYGKFDYGMVDGQAVLYDVNRTPTFYRKKADPDRQRRASTLADGINVFTQNSKSTSGSVV